MICADTSSFIAFIQHGRDRDCQMIAEALAQHQLVFSPVSLTELLSDPHLSLPLQTRIEGVPTLEITPGYWHRAGKLRAMLIGHHHRTKTADTLIAQSCLDHQVPLLTRDNDFLPFHKYAGLHLL